MYLEAESFMTVMDEFYSITKETIEVKRHKKAYLIRVEGKQGTELVTEKYAYQDERARDRDYNTIKGQLLKYIKKEDTSTEQKKPNNRYYN